MIDFRHITFAYIVLFILNQSVNSLKCHVCNPCQEPFDPNLNQTKEQSDSQGYYCAKVSTKYYVRRAITEFCPEFHVGSTGIWCCQTDLCNDGRKMISRISLSISMIIGILIKDF